MRFISGIASIAVHAALLTGMTMWPARPHPKAATVVQIKVERVVTPPPVPKEEPPPPPPPIPPPEIRPKLVKKRTVEKVVPDEPPPTPTKTEDPPPTPPEGFSVDMSNVVDRGAVPAVEGGGNMFADPNAKAPPGKKTSERPPVPSGTGKAPPRSGYQITRPARFLSSEEERRPPYPRQAKLREIEGTVLLNIYVGPTGKVEDVRLVHGIGYGCDEVAIEWARKKWRFEPAVSGDEPVGMWIPVPVRFELERE